MVYVSISLLLKESIKTATAAQTIYTYTYALHYPHQSYQTVIISSLNETFFKQWFPSLPETEP